MECKYCGNRSGMVDDRGNCISCGAPKEMLVGWYPGAVINLMGIMTRDEAGRRFLGMEALSSTTPNEGDMIIER